MYCINHAFLHEASSASKNVHISIGQSPALDIFIIQTHLTLNLLSDISPSPVLHAHVVPHSVPFLPLHWENIKYVKSHPPLLTLTLIFTAVFRIIGCAVIASDIFMLYPCALSELQRKCYLHKSRPLTRLGRRVPQSTVTPSRKMESRTRRSRVKARRRTERMVREPPVSK